VRNALAYGYVLAHFSMRFGPTPLIARKSSTLLNAPYDLRIFRILSAVEEPIPGTCCSSNAMAVFRFTGRSGGFLVAASGPATQKQRQHAQAHTGNDRANLWGSRMRGD
jgi:hypothetical protein